MLQSDPRQERTRQVLREALIALVAALLDELNVERVAVVGVSAGGPAALQFALRHPHRTCSPLTAMIRS